MRLRLYSIVSLLAVTLIGGVAGRAIAPPADCGVPAFAAWGWDCGPPLIDRGNPNERPEWRRPCLT